MAERLTDAQYEALDSLERHGDMSWHLAGRGMQPYGGLVQTERALVRRGLIAYGGRGVVLTDAGREALEVRRQARRRA